MTLKKVTNLKADIKDTSVILTFTGSIAAIAYDIYKDGKLYSTVSSNDNAVDVEVLGLKPNTIYGFKVVSKNETEKSTPASINVRTKK